MNGKKKYAVVRFSNTDSVEVIPTSWLINNKQGKWPPAKKSIFYVSRCIREYVTPEDDWQVLDLKVYRLSKSFRVANKLAQMALDMSNIETTSSEEDSDSHIRLRIKPVRFRDYSSEDEDIPKNKVLRGSIHHKSISGNEILSERPIQKQFHPPHIEITKVVSSTPNKKLDKCSSSFADSLISPEQATNIVSSILNATQRNEMSDSAKILTTLTKLVNCVVETQNEVKHLRNEIKEMKAHQIQLYEKEEDPSASLLLELPRGIEFPLSSDDDLYELDKKLAEDKNLQSVLIRYFNFICFGKTMSAFLLSVCRKILTKELAMQYSRLGRKGKKSFQSLPAITTVIFATVLTRFEVSRPELEEKFGKVLATASDWEGRKPKMIDVSNSTLDTKEYILSI